MELPITWVIPVAGLAAIAFALYLAWDVLHRDTGTEAMQEIAEMIFEGAVAFIRRQYRTIGLLAIGGAIVIGAVIAIVEGPSVADTSISGLPLGIRTGIAFLVGAACSMASGIIGMYISVRSNLRTAAAARSSLVRAVQTAMRGGAVSG
ncbi:MAG: sodium/proton-translocating pyrophosphatase, partial [Candidatus Limnocylindria bacterium]